MTRLFPYPRRAGAALIAVLWVVAVMGTIAMISSRRAQLSLKISRNGQEALKASLLAEAGAYRALAVLLDDARMTPTDHLRETWSDSETDFFDVPLGGGVYRLTRSMEDAPDSVAHGAVDESGKLNLNTATEEMLMQLPEADPVVIASILDWRDEDDDPRPEGAEAEYYQSLPEPYDCKNADFDTLDEVLLVRGMTPEILYGEDANANNMLDANENDGEASPPLDNADGQLGAGWHAWLTCYSYAPNEDGEGGPRVNVNTADRDELEEALGDELEDTDIDAIIEARDDEEFESVGDLLSAGGGGGGVLDRETFRAVAGRITVTDDETLPGRININTAPRQVLICLFEGNADLAGAVINHRESNEGPFDDIGELLAIEEITVNDFRDIADWVCVRSEVFSVRSAGYIERSNAYKEIYAIVDRGAEPPGFPYWKTIR